MQRVEKAPLQAFLCVHGAAREQQFGRTALADQAGQQRAGTHIGTSQANAGEQKSRLGLLRAKAHIGSQSHHRPSPGANAVNRRNDGLWAQPHGLDQLTRHARELQQLGHAHLGERANDFMHIAA